MDIIRMTSLPNITAQIIATNLDTRGQLVKLIDRDARISVIASVTISNAEEALSQLSPALIVAHSETDSETKILHQLAKKYPDTFFMLIVSGAFIPSANGSALNYVTSLKQNDLKGVVPDIISKATQSVQGLDLAVIDADEKARLQKLTKRELEILKLTAVGLKIDEIAKQLNRSHSTVAKHRENLMKKMHMHDRVALTRLAIREGLIEA